MHKLLGNGPIDCVKIVVWCEFMSYYIEISTFFSFTPPSFPEI